MQRPSVYVGVSDQTSSYSLSKPSPRHAPAAGYVVGEIVEEQTEDARPPPSLRKPIWSMKPEEAVHLIPAILLLSSLILSLPTAYNAYHGLPLSTTHRFNQPSVEKLQSMTSGDAIILHPDLGGNKAADSVMKISNGQLEWKEVENVDEVELRKKRVKSAGLGAAFEGDVGQNVHSENLKKLDSGVEKVRDLAHKIEHAKKKKSKDGRREKKTSDKKKARGGET